MQITKPAAPHALMSVPTVFAPTPLDRARNGLRWLFDIDDGVGGIVCFVCVLAVFGTLMVRLVQLDRSLDSQHLDCTSDPKTLQMHCEFK